MHNPREVLDRPAPPPQVTVAYGSHPDQIADVWLPATSSGLVIYVHGGFWRAEWDRTHARPLANALVAEGYTVATIEYRRTGQEGGGWPGSFDDVALAFDTLPRLVAEVAGGGAAGVSGPVVLAGHSAGGHLALWGAVRHRLPADSPWRLASPPKIAGVLALAPVADLADAYQRKLGDGAVAELLGDGPEARPERYAATDPGALPAPDVPVVLVHGALDDRVPVAQSQRYPAPLVELPDIEHFGVIDPLSPAWPAVVEALHALVTAGDAFRAGDT